MSCVVCRHVSCVVCGVSCRVSCVVSCVVSCRVVPCHVVSWCVVFELAISREHSIKNHEKYILSCETRMFEYLNISS